MPATCSLFLQAAWGPLAFLTVTLSTEPKLNIPPAQYTLNLIPDIPEVTANTGQQHVLDLWPLWWIECGRSSCGFWDWVFKSLEAPSLAPLEPPSHHVVMKPQPTSCGMRGHVEESPGTPPKPLPTTTHGLRTSWFLQPQSSCPMTSATSVIPGQDQQNCPDGQPTRWWETFLSLTTMFWSSLSWSNR